MNMMLLFLLCLSLWTFLAQPTPAIALRPVSHEWVELSSDSDMAAIFGSGMASFDTTESWNICHSGAGSRILFEEGVPDYTSRIVDALTSAEEKGSGLVKFGPGVFNVSSPIEIPTRTCIIGDSMDGTTIRLSNEARDFANKAIFFSREVERISVHKLTVDANRDNQDSDSEVSGFFFDHINYAWFRSVRVRNARGYGFHMHGSSDKRSSYIMIEGSIAHNNLEDGFKLDNVNYGSVANSLSQNNAMHGISITGGSKHSLIKNTRILANGERSNGCGVMFEKRDDMRPDDALVMTCQIFDSFVAGVCIDHAQSVEVRNSTIQNMVHAESACYNFVGAKDSSATDNDCEVASGVKYAKTAPISSKPLFKSPSPSSTSSPSPPSADDSDSDKQCTKGIAFKDVCCPRKCGKCGGPGCGDRLPGGVCCLKKVRKENKSCKEATAPCLMFSLEESETPDESCDTGILFKDVCCPAQCGACGGIGCGARLPHGACCIQKIRADNRGCSKHGPPCTLATALKPGASASASPTSSPSPSPSPIGDAVCAKGIAFKDVCCPRECGKCGGVGCGKRMRKGACCLSRARAERKSCDTHSAPCLMRYPPKAIDADKDCSTGIAVKDVCCPKACGKCGGAGCGARLPGGVCCMGKIRKDTNSCSKSGPPCMLSSPETAKSSPLPTPTLSESHTAGDLTCDNGIPFKDVCCPKKCGKCGGAGCGKRLPKGACCLSKAREESKSCADADAPCLLFSLPKASDADEKCKNGIVFKDVCCPKICGKCGGVDCGARLPNGSCCINSIRKDKNSCSKTGPPCTMEE